jgi:hypothetical protein
MLPSSHDPTIGLGRGWRLRVLVLLLAVGAVAPVPAPDPPRVPALWIPASGAVVRGFDARAGPYGPGHRGIDIAAPVGDVVRAPAAGRVVFAGPVAGTTWVTLLVAPGVLVSLGPMLGPVAPGGHLRARAPVGRVGPGHEAGPAGRVGPRHGAGPVGRVGRGRQAGPAGRVGSGGQMGTIGPVGPAGGATLHLGVRVDGVYVDPMAFLVDRPRPRLAPLATPGGRPG